MLWGVHRDIQAEVQEDVPQSKTTTKDLLLEFDDQSLAVRNNLEGHECSVRWRSICYVSTDVRVQSFG
jgi:hypothetical protein